MSDRVVAVVVHYADPETTERCVRSLLDAGLRVVVVDNGASYNSARPATEVIRPAANLGYGAGANLGLRRAFELAPYALLLNDDVTLEHPDAVERLVARLESDPTVGIAGPAVVGPSGEPQPTVEEWPSLPRALRLATRPYAPPVPAAEADVEAVNGVCMLLRGEAFDATGGFDERYFLYGEETDLCFRARAAGYRTVFVPAPAIVHHHPAGEVRGEAARHVRVNYVRFCRSHRGWLSAALVALLFLGSALVRRRGPRPLARDLAGVLFPGRGLLVDRLVVPALLAAWVVLLALGSSYRQSIRDLGSAGKFAILGVLIAIEVPRAARDPRRYLAELRPGWLDVAALALVAFGTVSAAWSMAPRHTLVFAAGLAAFFAAILLAPRRVARTPGGARALALGLVAGVAVVLVANLAALAAWHDESFTRSLNESRRFRGLLESSDEVGAYVLLAPLLLWWTIDARRGRDRLRSISPLGVALLALLVGELAASGTRTALALLFVGAAVFAAGYLRGATGALVAAAASAALLGLGAALIASPALEDATLPGFVRPSTLSSFGGRTEAWSAATHLIGRRPLGGFGLGNEGRSIHLYRDDGYRLYSECLALPAGVLRADCATVVPPSRRLVYFSGDNAHQSYLGLGVQLGVVLLVVVGVALLAAAGLLGLSVRARQGIVAACFAGVVAGLGEALVETYLFSPGNVVMPVFWLLLAIGLARSGAA